MCYRCRVIRNRCLKRNPCVECLQLGNLLCGLNYVFLH
ncbi:hypothetical protein EJP77_08535 [Paenibacillus zeisoli]|uniref:Zn(2)-C6 fungal-type domain-containing protein n=1 Tax=Paenibacillus zeisoli TaxID=2496267 RepID=A0A433XHZ3_9BACL|nr:hypothetical protein EJP77_08535 [Paenibacillus zeisoli]